MTVSYIPSKDEMLLKIGPVKGKPTKELGRFKFWWDTEGNICAVDIVSYTEELEEFRQNLNTIRLGGIWKSVKITDKDIQETREELLRRLEEKL
jgi:hypothetical protein